MDKPCDICAGFTDQGIAFEEVIITCSKCRIAREHIYCMRINPSLVEDWDLDNWVCESCEQGNGMLSPKSSIKEVTLESSAVRGHYDGIHSAGPSRSRNGSGWQAHSKRQKPVVTGKVRFISNEEARRLSLADTPQKTACGNKIVTPKSPVSRAKANPSIIRSEIEMPRRHVRPPKMKSISKINQQACQNLKHSQEKRAPGTPTKGHIIMEQPMDASVLSQRVETSSRMTVEEPNKFSCTPSTSRHSSLNMSYGGNTSAAEHNYSDDEERDLLNMFPSLHLYCSSLPALHSTWKGGFVILDAETPAQFVGGFQAQAPCTVHCKAYEFSRKMPPVLRANLLPRFLLWADPFRDECPDLQDVGLYFSPDDNIAGSRETYALLFEVMDTQNSVMRIYFDGADAVDLLIFTSKQLHLDSLNTVTSPRTENFLWGIFRDKNHCRADMDDNRTTVDMEVDMVGGKMVGIVDVVVPKDSSSPCRRSNVVVSKDSSTPCRMPEPIMNAVQQLLTIKKEEHSSFQTRLSVLDSTIKKLLGFNSEKPIMKEEHFASSEMKTTCGLHVKLEKDEDETYLETEMRTLPFLPCFPEPSPQSGAGSTDETVQTTSTVDEITVLRMLCRRDNHTRI